MSVLLQWQIQNWFTYLNICPSDLTEYYMSNLESVANVNLCQIYVQSVSNVKINKLFLQKIVFFFPTSKNLRLVSSPHQTREDVDRYREDDGAVLLGRDVVEGLKVS